MNIIYIITVLVCTAPPCDRAAEAQGHFVFERAARVTSSEECLRLASEEAARRGLIHGGRYVRARCAPGART